MLDIRIFYFGETEPSGFVREPVSHYAYGAGGDALLLEPRSQIRFGSAVREIANI